MYIYIYMYIKTTPPTPTHTRTRQEQHPKPPNTFTLNMYVSMPYTGLSRRITLFILLWLRHRNTEYRFNT